MNDDLIARDPAGIKEMFGRISPRYDLMNRLMTLGMDGGWRRLAAEQAQPAPGSWVLDACCGTGDLSFALAERYPSCHVVGLDFVPAMLERARAKTAKRGGDRSTPRFIQGDLLALPFPDGIFAAATVGWGVRNVADLRLAFAELTRVTRPGGRVVCLESTATQGLPGAGLHDAWMGGVVPALGRLVTGERHAYRYLPASVATFPDAEGLAAIMAGAGLVNVRYRALGMGAVFLHVGEVPTAGERAAPDADARDSGAAGEAPAP